MFVSFPLEKMYDVLYRKFKEKSETGGLYYILGSYICFGLLSVLFCFVLFYLQYLKIRTLHIKLEISSVVGKMNMLVNSTFSEPECWGFLDFLPFCKAMEAIRKPAWRKKSAKFLTDIDFLYLFKEKKSKAFMSIVL